MSEKISANFQWLDVTHSETADKNGIDNSLPEKLTPLVITQALLLERCRTELGNAAKRVVPLKVSSWFRSPTLNKRVGGKETSAHLKGLGTDVVPKGMTPSEAYEILKDSEVMREIDQLILERDKKGNVWLHIGQNPFGNPPRQQAFKLEEKLVTRTAIN